MSDRQKRRGRGVILELDPARIKPFVDNPRKRFRGIKQLADSIRLIGQVTPIVVTRCDEKGYDAELIDGERRLRACLLAKLPVRAVMEQDCELLDRYVRSVAANFCRQQHDAVEIMEAVLALRGAGRSNADIAGVFGKTESWVSQFASLRKLVPEVLEELKVAGDEAKLSGRCRRRRGKMTLSIALLLVPLDPRLQVKALRGIMVGKMGIADARTFVCRMATSKGRVVGKKVSTHARFLAVCRAVETCHHVIERYLCMPGVEIKALVRGATPQERRQVSKQLESLCDSLLLLSDELDKSSQ